MNVTKSRRYIERTPCDLPLTVKLFTTEKIELVEETQLVDISRGGARFSVGYYVALNQPVWISCAIPTLLRPYDRNAKYFESWGIVRSIAELLHDVATSARYEIGIAYIGKAAPPGYMEDHTKRYDLRPSPTPEGIWVPRLARSAAIF